MLPSGVTDESPGNGYPVDKFDPDTISIAGSNISVVLLLARMQHT
jgi:hypothetical protein